MAPEPVRVLVTGAAGELEEKNVTCLRRSCSLTVCLDAGLQGKSAMRWFR